MNAETVPAPAAAGKTSSADPIETWRRVWRLGVAPQLSTAGLVELARALRLDDPALLQGATVDPPGLAAFQRETCEGCCLIGFAGWRGERLTTVGEVEDYFSRICFGAEQMLGEPGVARWLLNWYDETPRVEMRRCVLFEVERELTLRAARAAEEAGLDLASEADQAAYQAAVDQHQAALKATSNWPPRAA